MLVKKKNTSRIGNLKQDDVKGHRPLILQRVFGLESVSFWETPHPAVLFRKSEQIYKGMLLNKQISRARNSDRVYF